MIVGALLNLLAVLGQIVSVPLAAITLPTWFNDGTITTAFNTLQTKIWNSPAPAYIDLPFTFGVLSWWWGFRLASIPVRWLLGVARRFLGPLVPAFNFDGTNGLTFGSEYGLKTREFQAAAQSHVDSFNAKHAEE